MTLVISGRPPAAGLLSLDVFVVSDSAMKTFVQAVEHFNPINFAVELTNAQVIVGIRHNFSCLGLMDPYLPKECKDLRHHNPQRISN